ncbi:MAG: ferrous iron transport protein B [Candidatus Marinimicrobia bacterium]|jgi:ferrous iron transport protein B|nr:ferrous iron transport protein B [Candidatus Neomarinimicrobiota bacterium]MDP6610940.1 ferrous iron transport protein B [Candidatus Neomarinimicrobiota bacterium]|tara:strand:+ start:4441 stop:6543 length:2103 start_codon:yes stop_codon:yes gene_type:complete
MKPHFLGKKQKSGLKSDWVALVGNPNSGKTAIFNLLTGLNQKVSNYPGITVEKKVGTIYTENDAYHILDLPGTYSLSPESFDEQIVSDQVLSWASGEDPPSVIISVVDASNLSRNLFLTSQLIDLDIPVVIALNMIDRLEDVKQLDLKALQMELGVEAVVPLSAKFNRGLDELRTEVLSAITSSEKVSHPFTWMTQSLKDRLLPLQDKQFLSPKFSTAHALRMLSRNISPNGNESQFKSIRKSISNLGFNVNILEATLRYEWIDKIVRSIQPKIEQPIQKISRSEKWDYLLTHQWIGPFIFVGILYFIFQSIFTWATIPMDWIQLGINQISSFVITQMPPGMLRDILVEGIIGGVGTIIIFLPQIIILSFFLTLMEDTGYMARVAFMLDRGMTKMGLHGKSILPLMSGYACAIPGIMSTRTIDSWKERLVTILILPLMSCSARLPVYTLLISAFIPPLTVGGYFQLQGLTLVIMYFLGTAVALILAKVFSLFIKEKASSSFVMELPPYRIPIARSVIRHIFIRGKLFLVNAGKVILAISIVLWFLASFPKVDQTISDVNPIHQSYAGKIGHAMEPVIRPLGFDWKIGIGLLTSFAAREVMVATMATIYNVADAGDETVNLKNAMRNDIDEKTGAPAYTPLVALALMVFYVFAPQCMATFAIVRQETNSWKWPLFMVAYMTVLAYFGALVVYQGGLLLGFS